MRLSILLLFVYARWASAVVDICSQNACAVTDGYVVDYVGKTALPLDYGLYRYHITFQPENNACLHALSFILPLCMCSNSVDLCEGPLENVDGVFQIKQLTNACVVTWSNLNADQGVLSFKAKGNFEMGAISVKALSSGGDTRYVPICGPKCNSSDICEDTPAPTTKTSALPIKTSSKTPAGSSKGPITPSVSTGKPTAVSSGPMIKSSAPKTPAPTTECTDQPSKTSSSKTNKPPTTSPMPTKGSSKTPAGSSKGAITPSASTGRSALASSKASAPKTPAPTTECTDQPSKPSSSKTNKPPTTVTSPPKLPSSSKPQVSKQTPPGPLTSSAKNPLSSATKVPVATTECTDEPTHNPPTHPGSSKPSGPPSLPSSSARTLTKPTLPKTPAPTSEGTDKPPTKPSTKQSTSSAAPMKSTSAPDLSTANTASPAKTSGPSVPPKTTTTVSSQPPSSKVSSTESPSTSANTTPAKTTTSIAKTSSSITKIVTTKTSSPTTTTSTAPASTPSVSPQPSISSSSGVVSTTKVQFTTSPCITEQEILCSSDSKSTISNGYTITVASIRYNPETDLTTYIYAVAFLQSNPNNLNAISFLFSPCLCADEMQPLAPVPNNTTDIGGTFKSNRQGSCSAMWKNLDADEGTVSFQFAGRHNTGPIVVSIDDGSASNDLAMICGPACGSPSCSTPSSSRKSISTTRTVSTTKLATSNGPMTPSSTFQTTQLSSNASPSSTMSSSQAQTSSAPSPPPSTSVPVVSTTSIPPSTSIAAPSSSAPVFSTTGNLVSEKTRKPTSKLPCVFNQETICTSDVKTTVSNGYNVTLASITYIPESDLTSFTYAVQFLPNTPNSLQGISFSFPPCLCAKGMQASASPPVQPRDIGGTFSSLSGNLCSATWSQMNADEGMVSYQFPGLHNVGPIDVTVDDGVLQTTGESKICGPACGELTCQKPSTPILPSTVRSMSSVETSSRPSSIPKSTSKPPSPSAASSSAPTPSTSSAVSSLARTSVRRSSCREKMRCDSILQSNTSNGYTLAVNDIAYNGTNDITVASYHISPLPGAVVPFNTVVIVLPSCFCAELITPNVDRSRSDDIGGQFMFDNKLCSITWTDIGRTDGSISFSLPQERNLGVIGFVIGVDNSQISPSRICGPNCGPPVCSAPTTTPPTSQTATSIGTTSPSSSLPQTSATYPTMTSIASTQPVTSGGSISSPTSFPVSSPQMTSSQTTSPQTPSISSGLASSQPSSSPTTTRFMSSERITPSVSLQITSAQTSPPPPTPAFTSDGPITPSASSFATTPGASSIPPSPPIPTFTSDAHITPSTSSVTTQPRVTSTQSPSTPQFTSGGPITPSSSSLMTSSQVTSPNPSLTTSKFTSGSPALSSISSATTLPQSTSTHASPTTSMFTSGGPITPSASSLITTSQGTSSNPSLTTPILTSGSPALSSTSSATTRSQSTSTQASPATSMFTSGGPITPSASSLITTSQGTSSNPSLTTPILTSGSPALSSKSSLTTQPHTTSTPPSPTTPTFTSGGPITPSSTAPLQVTSTPPSSTAPISTSVSPMSSSVSSSTRPSQMTSSQSFPTTPTFTSEGPITPSSSSSPRESSSQSTTFPTSAPGTSNAPITPSGLPSTPPPQTVSTQTTLSPSTPTFTSGGPITPSTAQAQSTSAQILPRTSSFSSSSGFASSVTSAQPTSSSTMISSALTSPQVTSATPSPTTPTFTSGGPITPPASSPATQPQTSLSQPSQTTLSFTSLGPITPSTSSSTSSPQTTSAQPTPATPTSGIPILSSSPTGAPQSSSSKPKAPPTAPQCTEDKPVSSPTSAKSQKPSTQPSPTTPLPISSQPTPASSTPTFTSGGHITPSPSLSTIPPPASTIKPSQITPAFTSGGPITPSSSSPTSLSSSSAKTSPVTPSKSPKTSMSPSPTRTKEAHQSSTSSIHSLPKSTSSNAPSKSPTKSSHPKTPSKNPTSGPKSSQKPSPHHSSSKSSSNPQISTPSKSTVISSKSTTPAFTSAGPISPSSSSSSMPSTPVVSSSKPSNSAQASTSGVIVSDKSRVPTSLTPCRVDQENLCSAESSTTISNGYNITVAAIRYNSELDLTTYSYAVKFLPDNPNSLAGISFFLPSCLCANNMQATASIPNEPVDIGGTFSSQSGSACSAVWSQLDADEGMVSYQFAGQHGVGPVAVVVDDGAPTDTNRATICGPTCGALTCPNLSTSAVKSSVSSQPPSTSTGRTSAIPTVSSSLVPKSSCSSNSMKCSPLLSSNISFGYDLSVVDMAYNATTDITAAVYSVKPNSVDSPPFNTVLLVLPKCLCTPGFQTTVNRMRPDDIGGQFTFDNEQCSMTWTGLENNQGTISFLIPEQRNLGSIGFMIGMDNSPIVLSEICGPSCGPVVCTTPSPVPSSAVTETSKAPALTTRASISPSTTASTISASSKAPASTATTLGSTFATTNSGSSKAPASTTATLGSTIASTIPGSSKSPASTTTTLGSTIASTISGSSKAPASTTATFSSTIASTISGSSKAPASTTTTLGSTVVSTISGSSKAPVSPSTSALASTTIASTSTTLPRTTKPSNPTSSSPTQCPPMATPLRCDVSSLSTVSNGFNLSVHDIRFDTSTGKSIYEYAVVAVSESPKIFNTLFLALPRCLCMNGLDIAPIRIRDDDLGGMFIFDEEFCLASWSGLETHQGTVSFSVSGQFEAGDIGLMVGMDVAAVIPSKVCGPSCSPLHCDASRLPTTKHVTSADPTLSSSRRTTVKLTTPPTTFASQLTTTSSLRLVSSTTAASSKAPITPSTSAGPSSSLPRSSCSSRMECSSSLMSNVSNGYDLSVNSISYEDVTNVTSISYRLQPIAEAPSPFNQVLLKLPSCACTPKSRVIVQRDRSDDIGGQFVFDSNACTVMWMGLETNQGSISFLVPGQFNLGAIGFMIGMDDSPVQLSEICGPVCGPIVCGTSSPSTAPSPVPSTSARFATTFSTLPPSRQFTSASPIPTRTCGPMPQPQCNATMQTTNSSGFRVSVQNITYDGGNSTLVYTIRPSDNASEPFNTVFLALPRCLCAMGIDITRLVKQDDIGGEFVLNRDLCIGTWAGVEHNQGSVSIKFPGQFEVGDVGLMVGMDHDAVIPSRICGPSCHPVRCDSPAPSSIWRTSSPVPSFSATSPGPSSVCPFDQTMSCPITQGRPSSASSDMPPGYSVFVNRILFNPTTNLTTFNYSIRSTRASVQSPLVIKFALMPCLCNGRKPIRASLTDRHDHVKTIAAPDSTCSFAFATVSSNVLSLSMKLHGRYNTGISKIMVQSEGSGKEEFDICGPVCGPFSCPEPSIPPSTSKMISSPVVTRRFSSPLTEEPNTPPGHTPAGHSPNTPADDDKQVHTPAGDSPPNRTPMPNPTPANGAPNHDGSSCPILPTAAKCKLPSSYSIYSGPGVVSANLVADSSAQSAISVMNSALLFSYSTWVYLDGYGSSNTVLFSRNNQMQGFPGLSITSEGLALVTLQTRSSSDSTLDTCRSTTPIPIRQWTQISFSVDSGSNFISIWYNDGSNARSWSCAFRAGNHFVASYATLNLGSAVNASSPKICMAQTYFYPNVIKPIDSKQCLMSSSSTSGDSNMKTASDNNDPAASPSSAPKSNTVTVASVTAACVVGACCMSLLACFYVKRKRARANAAAASENPSYP